MSSAPTAARRAKSARAEAALRPLQRRRKAHNNYAPFLEAASAGRLYFRTSYSKATPSGSFSANHFPRRRHSQDLEVIGVADLLAGVDVDPDCFHEASRLIRQHASRLTRETWQAKTPDFNRALDYPNVGVA